jgi:hypothetical protein
MPWKTSSVMEEKMRFVVEYEEGEQTMTELCQRYQISRETGYVWLRRYPAAGVVGLCGRDRSAFRHSQHGAGTTASTPALGTTETQADSRARGTRTAMAGGEHGRHERMDRSSKQEAATPPATNRRTQQRVLDHFRQEYNQVRPQEALQKGGWWAGSQACAPGTRRGGLVAAADGGRPSRLPSCVRASRVNKLPHSTGGEAHW